MVGLADIISPTLSCFYISQSTLADQLCIFYVILFYIIYFYALFIIFIMYLQCGRRQFNVNRQICKFTVISVH